MAETHARRRDTLRTRLRTDNLDALLITNLLNIRYLTGFTGSNAALLVHAEDDAAERRTVFCTDGRYTTQSEAEVPDLNRVIDRRSDLAMAAEAARRSADYRRLGYESNHVTVDRSVALGEMAEGIELIRAAGHTEALREFKDDAEIESVRRACAAADRALADLLDHGGLRAGRTERAIARELADRMLDAGADDLSFETIVAGGEHSAIPHHTPTGRELQPGDLIKMDFGALVDGYHSDMTRTLVLGRPADWQRELYELVRVAQQAGLDAVRDGTATRDVDSASRTLIDRAGYADNFTHGLGHGVGLEIHEAPSLAKTGEGKLAPGMTVTVEPGVYLPGKGGVRIEDTLVVRAGGPELLSMTTKDLVVV